MATETDWVRKLMMGTHTAEIIHRGPCFRFLRGALRSSDGLGAKRRLDRRFPGNGPKGGSWAPPSPEGTHAQDAQRTRLEPGPGPSRRRAGLRGIIKS